MLRTMLFAALTGACVAMAATLWSIAGAAGGADLEFGKYLSGECVTCHRLKGETKGIPSITGWPEESFIVVLNSFKNGERKNKAMENVTKNLSKEEIAALAAYYGSLPAQE